MYVCMYVCMFFLYVCSYRLRARCDYEHSEGKCENELEMQGARDASQSWLERAYDL